MKSLAALCTGVMTLVAASSLFVSCYDDSALREDLEEIEEELDGVKESIAAIEELKSELESLIAGIPTFYTLLFQVTEDNELQYSFDNGATWTDTGIVLVGECDCEPVPPCDHVCPPCDHECPPCQYVPCEHNCPEISVVDNGASVTIKIGEAEFTIEKPEEIVFEIRAGKVYFESESTLKVPVKSSGVADVTVIAAPKGWWAEINADGQVEITAPDYEKTQGEYGWDENDEYYELPAECAASGFVKVHACSTDGKCMVGKISVEVASQALSVKAYSGKAFFNIAGASSWAPTFYYGVAARDSFEADVEELLEALNAGAYEVLEYFDQNWGEASVTVPVADLLGEEPVVGQEYVVWAIREDYSKPSYSIEDVVLAYYSPVKVEVTEVEAERAAFNVTVDVNVYGTDSYVAVAMPESQLEWTSVEELKEQMVMAYAEGDIYGKLYNEPYSGSALDIAAGTSYSMTGNYSPDSDVYIFILPLDGRPAEDYTIDDVAEAKFTTSPLLPGASIELAVEQVTEYWGEVYDYDILDYVTTLITLDPYTQLGVKITPSVTSDWSAFYFTWMDEATYADYGAYEEDVVDYLLENAFPNSPAEITEWPLYHTATFSPNTTMHFVAIMVDNAGKYSKVAHIEATTKELVKADYVWAEPYTTNLQDGVLKNTKTLQFTPAFEGGAEPASYKYVLSQVTYYNPYEGKDDAQMAEELYFSTSYDVKTITAEELANGVLYVEDHKYGNPYYFAIVPIDAEGNPGASAAILEYECVFEMDNVVTEGAEFEATAPQIKVNFPEEWECYPDNGWGDASYYGYAYSSWDEMYQFYYEINFDVTPAEGTEVCAVLVDAENYNLDVEANIKAGSAWAGSYGSWATITTAEPVSSSHKYYSHYENQAAPNVVLVVSWVDAAGTYYYKEYPLQEQFQYYADLMSEYIAGTKEIPGKPAVDFPTPDGKQWAFTWAAMGGVPTVLDFGVTLEGQCVVAYDPVVMGAPEGTPYQIYNMIAYEFVATDATSGKLTLTTTNMFGEELSQEFEYSNLTETSCHFEFDETSFVGESVDGTLTEVVVDTTGGVM